MEKASGQPQVAPRARDHEVIRLEPGQWFPPVTDRPYRYTNARKGSAFRAFRGLERRRPCGVRTAEERSAQCDSSSSLFASAMILSWIILGTIS